MMLLKAYLVNKLQYIADKLRNRTFSDIQKDIQRILKNLTNCNTASEWLFRDETVRIAEAPTVFARAERQFARERP